MDAHQLRDDAKRIEAELHRRWKQIEEIEHNCQHMWGSVEYVPTYHEAHTIPSDLSRGVYLGVDTITSDTHVPAQTKRQWQRTCTKCGRIQKTTITKKQPGQGNIPGCGAEFEMPDFGDRK